MASFFVEKGKANILAKNNYGVTPLDFASRRGNTAVLEYLSSVAKNTKDLMEKQPVPQNTNTTPQKNTKKKENNFDVSKQISKLVTDKANQLADEGEDEFTEEEQKEIIRFCKKYGINVNVVDENGETLIHKAVKHGKITQENSRFYGV